KLGHPYQERGSMFPHSSLSRKLRLKMIAGVSVVALTGIGLTLRSADSDAGSIAAAASVQTDVERIHTETPIKHIIYIIGENRSFDNIYATYVPKYGQKIWNLLSQGIVNADGTPGKNFANGRQFQATSNNGQFLLSPLAKQPYTFL